MISPAGDPRRCLRPRRSTIVCLVVLFGAALHPQATALINAGCPGGKWPLGKWRFQLGKTMGRCRKITLMKVLMGQQYIYLSSYIINNKYIYNIVCMYGGFSIAMFEYRFRFFFCRKGWEGGDPFHLGAPPAGFPQIGSLGFPRCSSCWPRRQWWTLSSCWPWPRIGKTRGFGSNLGIFWV